MTQILTIRKANITDVKDIMSLISEFYEEGLKESGLNFTEQSLSKTTENFINNGIVIVVLDNETIIGLISGTIAPSMFDITEKIAQELMWFIKKEYRKGSLAKDLLNRFEKEALSLGAKQVVMGIMGTMNIEILDKFYRRKGYKLLETQYIKRIEGGENEDI